MLLKGAAQRVSPPSPEQGIPAPSAIDRVRAYHERAKHHLDRYAAKPETLDWDSPPAPFRRFVGAPRVSLPRVADLDLALSVTLDRSFAQLAEGAPVALSLHSLGALLELALGITAWKSQGPDRWAVRANPSSGNLHPVEAYVIVLGVAGLGDGVYHYSAEDHALEWRARWKASQAEAAPRAWVALTTIIWREAWKYGERAFRYCQLDTGHAMTSFDYAARVLGWRVTEQSQVGWDTLGQVLGVHRSQDFAQVRHPETEREEPEVLLELEVNGPLPRLDPAAFLGLASRAHFSGQASPIDPRPMYTWPIVDEVAAATRWPDALHGEPERRERPACSQERPDNANELGLDARELILRRRSAQRFDGKFVLERSAFVRILHSFGCPPAAMGWRREPSLVDLIVFVHRVESLASGVYLLPCSADSSSSLFNWLKPRFGLRRVCGTGDGLELLELATIRSGELARIVRNLHCHQDIAANGCFALGMLADLDRVLSHGAAAYRRVLRQAGSIGHALYLRAEQEGVRGTGIGCFFDDAVTEFIGLGGTPVRSLYHFSVGRPIEDPRIETTSAKVE